MYSGYIYGDSNSETVASKLKYPLFFYITSISIKIFHFYYSRINRIYNLLYLNTQVHNKKLLPSTC